MNELSLLVFALDKRRYFARDPAKIGRFDCELQFDPLQILEGWVEDL